MPLDPGEEDYDIAPTEEIIQRRTGAFFTSGAWSLLDSKLGTKSLKRAIDKIPKTDEKKLQEVINSPRKLRAFLRKYGKHLKLIISEPNTEKAVGELRFNIKTGEFFYYTTQGLLSPKTQEFKILQMLVMNSGKLVTYSSLLRRISNFTCENDEVGYYHKRNLALIIKQIKLRLGILPKNRKGGTMPDIIENISKAGYRIIKS